MERRPKTTLEMRPAPLLDVPIDQLHRAAGIPLPGMQPAATVPEAAQEEPVRPEAGLGVDALLTDEDMVRRCEELLQKYKSGKTQLEARIIENERWYRQRHANRLPRGDETDAVHI
jgi:hypothetical protein